MIMALGLTGCASQLERGWRNDDGGRSQEAIKNFSLALIDADETYRGIAGQELVRIGRPAIPALSKVLARRGHYYDLYYSGARREAALALGRIGSAEAVLPLLSTLKASKETYREEELILEMKELGGRATLARMVDAVAGRTKKDEVTIVAVMERYLEEVWTVFQEALGDEDKTYREEELASAREAIQVLPLKGEEGREVKEKSLEILNNVLRAKRTSGPSELIPSIRALGEIGSKQAVESLLEMLKETYAKSEAALALARIGDQRAIRYLKKAWEGEEEGEIKMSLEAALYLMGDETKWDLLMRKLKEGNLRRQAARLLGEIGKKQAVKPLIEALKDESKELREEAVRALGQIGPDPDASEALIEALSDEEAEVRKMAILALGKWKREALRKVLESEEEKLEIRLLTAGLLREGKLRVKLTKTEVISEIDIQTVVRDKETYSEGQRLAAIRALGMMGSEEASGILSQIYKDKKESCLMRFEARKALGMGGDI